MIICSMIIHVDQLLLSWQLFSIPIGVCMFSNPIKHMTISAYLTTSTYTVFVTTY